MTIADILTFVGIAVSVIFGFFVTHFYSIKDNRTRVLKNYYIEQVKAIKGRVDQFFHKVIFGKSSFQTIVIWNQHLSIDIKSIDDGVRKSLDMQIPELYDFLDRYYGEITKWENLNNQFSAPHYIPDTEHRLKLQQMKYEIDEFFNDYISHINQANNYPIWTIQINRIRRSKTFYAEEGNKFPLFRAIWERIEKHIWEILVIIAIIVMGIFFISKIKIEEKDDLATPLTNIASKQDSIFREIQLLREKYTPTKVQSKTFTNSTFFSTNKVDSVEIKLYQGKTKQ